MSKAKDYYSNSVTGAIRQACADFGTPQEKLDIEVVATGSKGIFGLCKKRAHIRVNLKKGSTFDSHVTEPRKKKDTSKPHSTGDRELVAESTSDSSDKETPEKKEKKTKAETAPSSREQSREVEFTMPSDEVLESIKTDLSEILRLMGFESEVRVKVVNQVVLCDISGEHEESIVGPEGRSLDSLQYLVRKMASRRLPEKMMIDLDAGNFRERRAVELQQLAVEMAEQVKETGKTMAIPALNPSERRVVHVVLQDDKGVRSRSVGEGIFKKILIYKPGKGKKSGGRRRGRQSGGSSQQ